MAMMRVAPAVSAMGRSGSVGVRVTSYSLQANDRPQWIGQARAALDRNLAPLREFGQFFLDIASLEEQADAARLQETLGNFDELGERRERPRRHHIGWGRFCAVESRQMDRRVGSGDPDSLAQKRRFPPIGIDEMTICYTKNTQDESGQPGTAAKVDQATGLRGNQRIKLCRVENMS